MQNLQLSIPTPCHENWDKMNPTEQGRFCNACAKQVIDFTTMSDAQVLHYFVDKKDDNICGRTLPNQLNRILEAPKPITQSKIWYWKYAAAAGLLFMNKNGFGQGKIVNNASQIYQPNKVLTGMVGRMKTDDNKIISGKITDENENAIAFATIRIKGTNKATTANEKGNYTLKVNIEKDILEISSLDIVKKELVLKGLKNYYVVCQVNKQLMLGAVVVVGGMSSNYEYNEPIVEEKNIAIIKVIDSATGKTIVDSKLIITKNNKNKKDTIQLKNGAFKIKRIDKNETYFIKAFKESYETKSIQISKANFTKRKQTFEIQLVKISEKPRGEFENNTRIMIGGIKRINENIEPLLLVDGKVVALNMLSNINPQDIEKQTIIKGKNAVALYGPNGVNGVISIITKKIICKNDTLISSDYKLLNNVTVNSNTYNTKKTTSGGIMVSRFVRTSKKDTIIQKIQTVFSPIKVYPNPVKKGEVLNIIFPNKNKYYSLQIINVAGLVVLQNKINETASKNITQQIIASSNWSSGFYFLNILNENGKVVGRSSFVVL